MADMIEVIDALERCKPYCMCDDEGCPYYQTVGCIEVVRKDALELLKEYAVIKETLSDGIHETAKMFRREG